MGEKRAVWDVRFITMIIGNEVVKVQGPTSLEQQAQECELAIFFETLRPRLCCGWTTGVR